MKERFYIMCFLFTYCSWGQVGSLTDYEVRLVNPENQDVLMASLEDFELDLVKFKNDSISFTKLVKESYFYNDGGFQSIFIDENKLFFERNMIDSLYFPILKFTSKELSHKFEEGYRLAIINDYTLKSNIINSISTLLAIEDKPKYLGVVLDDLLAIRNVIENQFTPVSRDKLYFIENLLSNYNLIMQNPDKTFTESVSLLNENLNNLASDFTDVKGSALDFFNVPIYNEVEINVYNKEGNIKNNVRVFYTFEAYAHLKITNRYEAVPTLCSPCKVSLEKSKLKYRFWVADRADSEKLSDDDVTLVPDGVTSIKLDIKLKE